MYELKFHMTQPHTLCDGFLSYRGEPLTDIMCWCHSICSLFSDSNLIAVHTMLHKQLFASYSNSIVGHTVSWAQKTVTDIHLPYMVSRGLPFEVWFHPLTQLSPNVLWHLIWWFKCGDWLSGWCIYFIWSAEHFVSQPQIYPTFKCNVSSLTLFPNEKGCLDYTLIDHTVWIIVWSGSILQLLLKYWNWMDPLMSLISLLFSSLQVSCAWVIPFCDIFKLQFVPSIKSHKLLCHCGVLHFVCTFGRQNLSL